MFRLEDALPEDLHLFGGQPVIKSYKGWPMSHIVRKRDIFAVCGIAPAAGWDSTVDGNKEVCRHCINHLNRISRSVQRDFA